MTNNFVIINYTFNNAIDIVYNSVFSRKVLSKFGMYRYTQEITEKEPNIYRLNLNNFYLDFTQEKTNNTPTSRSITAKVLSINEKK